MTLVPANSRGANAVSSVFGRTGVVAAANGDYNGVVASALTGATAATRYVGGTASGAPVSGTFAVGDFVIDQTAKVFVCTVLGTPGTWVQVGGGGGGFTVGASYLKVSSPNAAGKTSGSTFSPPWSTVVDSAGSDLSVNGGNNTLIDIATSGWYVAMAAISVVNGNCSDIIFDITTVSGSQYWEQEYETGVAPTSGLNGSFTLTTEPAEWTAGQQLFVEVYGQCISPATTYDANAPSLSIVRMS